MHEIRNLMVRRITRRDALRRHQQLKIRGRNGAAVGRATWSEKTDEAGSEPAFAPDASGDKPLGREIPARSNARSSRGLGRRRNHAARMASVCGWGGAVDLPFL